MNRWWTVHIRALGNARRPCAGRGVTTTASFYAHNEDEARRLCRRLYRGWQVTAVEPARA